MSEPAKDKGVFHKFRAQLAKGAVFIALVGAVVMVYYHEREKSFSSLFLDEPGDIVVVQPVIDPKAPPKQTAIERQVASLEQRVSTLETQALTQEASNEVYDFQRLEKLLLVIQKIPQAQEKLFRLKIAIEEGRPFYQEYQELAPYLNADAQDMKHNALFGRLAYTGVQPYEQLKGSFRGVGRKILCTSQLDGSWKEQILGFLRSVFLIQPKPRLVPNPETVTDYVTTIEAMLRLRDTSGILRLLDQLHQVNLAEYRDWQQAFRDYCFALDMHKALTEQVYSLHFKEF